MDLSQFKAWFEGFTEALDGPPGPKAWKRICEQVEKIVATPTPWPTIIREYVPRYPAWPPYYPYWGGSPLGVGIAQSNMNQLGDGHSILCSTNAGSDTPTLTSTDDAFRLIGRFDAEAMQGAVQ